MYKKAVLINISEAALDTNFWEALDTLVESKVLIGRDDPGLEQELKEADCVLLGYQVAVGSDLIDSAPNLKYIGILATAYGTVDLEHAAKRDIAVTNLGSYSNESVAEFTIAALLWQMRSIQEGLARSARSEFDETGIKARELRGTQFGVVGLGSIGNRVAELANGFGAEVSYWSRAPKGDSFSYKTLDDLVKESDIISVNVAESPDTIGLLDAAKIATLKNDALLITTVPLSTIDMDALFEKVKASDIIFISDHGEDLNEEELKKWRTLGERATFFPAIAYITKEARLAKQQIFIDNIRSSLGGTITNRVN